MVKLAGTNIEVPIRGGIIKGLMESRGEVSGAVGSFENGTPNTKVDVVFYVDHDNTMTPDDVADRVDEYRNWLLSRELDANVTIVDVASADYFEAAVASTTGLRADARKYAVSCNRRRNCGSRMI
ncbi:MAG: hypothetical protein ACOX4M_00870 [Acetivibrionales bacterium]